MSSVTSLISIPELVPCGICLEDINPRECAAENQNSKVIICPGVNRNNGSSDDVTENKIQHIFHEECALKWFQQKSQNTCPTCRRSPFIQEDKTPRPEVSNQERINSTTSEVSRVGALRRVTHNRPTERAGRIRQASSNAHSSNYLINQPSRSPNYLINQPARSPNYYNN